MGELQITSGEVDGALVVRLAGTPGMTDGAQLQALVADTVASGMTKVVIDLSSLDAISSLVAGRLVAMQNFLKRQNGRAIIVGPNEMVKHALVRMRVATIIPIVETIELALAHVPQESARNEPAQKAGRSLFSSGQ